MKKLLVGLGILGLTGAITVGALTGGSKKRAEEIPNNPTNIETETDYDAGEDDGAQYEAEEAEKGIKDGYGAPGLWLSENKDHDYDYGDAKEVFTATMNDYPDGLCGGPLAISAKGSCRAGPVSGRGETISITEQGGDGA